MLALRTFEAAARFSSFTEASRALNVTPSAVSHQIHLLEEYFGCKLFTRGRRHIQLTVQGTALAGRLSEGLNIIEAACADLKPNTSVRSIVVHSNPSFAAKWLSPRIPDFLHRHPKIVLHLRAGPETIDLLQQYDVNMVIGYGPAVEVPGLIVEDLGEEEVVALCRPSDEGPIESPTAPLFDLPLIESSGNLVRWVEWFALNGLSMAGTRKGPSFDRAALAVAAATQGLGITLESYRFAENELENGDLVALGRGTLRPVKRRMHFMAYRKAQRESHALQTFRSWLLAQNEGMANALVGHAGSGVN